MALDFALHRRQNIIVGTNNNNWTTCSVTGYHLMRLLPSSSYNWLSYASLLCSSTIGWCAYMYSPSLVGSFVLTFFRLMLEFLYKRGVRKSRQLLILSVWYLLELIGHSWLHHSFLIFYLISYWQVTHYRAICWGENAISAY